MTRQSAKSRCGWSEHRQEAKQRQRSRRTLPRLGREPLRPMKTPRQVLEQASSTIDRHVAADARELNRNYVAGVVTGTWCRRRSEISMCGEHPDLSRCLRKIAG